MRTACIHWAGGDVERSLKIQVEKARRDFRLDVQRVSGNQFGKDHGGPYRVSITVGTDVIGDSLDGRSFPWKMNIQESGFTERPGNAQGKRDKLYLAVDELKSTN